MKQKTFFFFKTSTLSEFFRECCFSFLEKLMYLVILPNVIVCDTKIFNLQKGKELYSVLLISSGRTIINYNMRLKIKQRFEAIT